MTSSDKKLLIFTDLDGCLLNKTDYDYSAAKPVLHRLQQAHIPLMLCSSKTKSEMSVLSQELGLSPAPMTCENGGVIVWSVELTGDDPMSMLGHDRVEILKLLKTLKNDFAFRSFADLGVDGVMAATDLPRDKAAAASDRHCTEPLVWDDAADRIDDFRTALSSAGLTLTEGGRFWHIAAAVTKGSAMQHVIDRFQTRNSGQTFHSVAIGDSPIDQSMLDVADTPIAIPQPDGTQKASVDAKRGVVASQPGAAGWAEAVGNVLDRLGIRG